MGNMGNWALSISYSLYNYNQFMFKNLYLIQALKDFP